jgi:predicted CopG family antitoxin
MSKNLMISDDAYAALLQYKKESESFSEVIKRLAPPPIRTFGDLEKYLDELDGPLFSDMKALDRIKARKKKSNAH